MSPARELLRSAGAGDDVLPELEVYLENPYAGLNDGRLPLKREPQVEFWERYVGESRRDGVVAALARRFPQLLFPITEGLSQEAEYRAATRRGEFPRHPARGGLALDEPETLELFLDDGPAGPVPVLVARHRPDFVSLVRALTCRNEPEPVPDSMGACLVKGLADWERVRAYRAEWEGRLGRSAPDAEWATEMGTVMAPQKELWQDRLILLSNGPYSAVPASDVGVEDTEWRERSVAIRLAHESFHYLTLRLSGTMRSHFLDELVADYAGLVAAFGRYDRALALRFLGIDRLPEIRPGGRLVNYRGSLPDVALAVLARLLERAASELESLPPVGANRPAETRARRLVTLASLGLDGLASPGLAARVEAREA